MFMVYSFSAFAPDFPYCLVTTKALFSAKRLGRVILFSGWSLMGCGWRMNKLLHPQGAGKGAGKSLPFEKHY
jgi:hypothetical protein